MDRFYWLQERDANERNVLVQNNVRIYDGDEMVSCFKNFLIIVFYFFSLNFSSLLIFLFLII